MGIVEDFLAAQGGGSSSGSSGGGSSGSSTPFSMSSGVVLDRRTGQTTTAPLNDPYAQNTALGAALTFNPNTGQWYDSGIRDWHFDSPEDVAKANAEIGKLSAETTKIYADIEDAIRDDNFDAYKYGMDRLDSLGKTALGYRVSAGNATISAASSAASDASRVTVANINAASRVASAELNAMIDAAARSAQNAFKLDEREAAQEFEFEVQRRQNDFVGRENALDRQIQQTRVGNETRDSQVNAAKVFSELIGQTDPAAFQAFLEAGGGNISNAIAQGNTAVSDLANLPAARALQAAEGGPVSSGGIDTTGIIDPAGGPPPQGGGSAGTGGGVAPGTGQSLLDKQMQQQAFQNEHYREAVANQNRQMPEAPAGWEYAPDGNLVRASPKNLTTTMNTAGTLPTSLQNLDPVSQQMMLNNARAEVAAGRLNLGDLELAGLGNLASALYAESLRPGNILSTPGGLPVPGSFSSVAGGGIVQSTNPNATLALGNNPKALEPVLHPYDVGAVYNPGNAITGGINYQQQVLGGPVASPFAPPPPPPPPSQAGSGLPGKYDTNFNDGYAPPPPPPPNPFASIGTGTGMGSWNTSGGVTFGANNLPTNYTRDPTTGIVRDSGGRTQYQEGFGTVPQLARGGVTGLGANGAMAIVGDAANGARTGVEEMVINLNPDPNDRIAVVPLNRPQDAMRVLNQIPAQANPRAMEALTNRFSQIPRAAEGGIFVDSTAHIPSSGGVLNSFGGGIGSNAINPGDQPFLDRVREIRENPDGDTGLGGFEADFFQRAPTVQNAFLTQRQRRFGVPIADQLAEIQKYALPGIRRSGIRQGL